MKTALARRNEWARQLRLMQEERRRRTIESEPEGKFKTTTVSEPNGNRRRLTSGSTSK